MLTAPAFLHRQNAGFVPFVNKEKSAVIGYLSGGGALCV